MPAKSISQQKLMGWAYSCKNGQNKNCPDHIKKLSDQMSKKDLKDFAKTKHIGLPNKLKEGLVYKYDKSNKVLLKIFYDWLDQKGIDYVPNKETGELEILNNHKLNQYDQKKLLNFINKLELQKVWEDGNSVGNTSNVGNYATLAGTIGMGHVNPPGAGPTMTGSGDKWEPILPPSVRKKKKEEEMKMAKDNDPIKYLNNYKEFVKSKKRK